MLQHTYLTLLTLSLIPAQQLTTPIYASQPQHGKLGGVAADAKLCSQLGLKTLKSGGNAVDASIISTLCQGVVHPFASGIGGGGFMVVKRKSEDHATFINFREVAPAKATRDMFVTDSWKSTYGALAAGVPGEVKGLFEAHSRFGKLDWKQLVLPVVDLARHGHNATKQLELRLLRQEARIRNSTDLLNIYGNPDGSLKKENQLVKYTKLADTLELIANQGPDAFYKGKVAQSIVDTITKNGGIFTLEDLHNYEVRVQKTYKAKVFNHDLYFPPPPSSGPVLKFILKAVESIANKLPNNQPLDNQYLHKLIEVFKFGFAGRSLLGDPQFKNITQQLNYLLSDSKADLVSQHFKPNTTFLPPFYYRDIGLDLTQINDDFGTSHISVLDREGLAVSVTSTVNTEFGSKLLDPNTGILFNNEMDDFSIPGKANEYGLQPSPYNFVQPGKVPQSSMAPVILTNKHDGSLIVIGASGGSRIISGVAQTLIQILNFGSKLNEALDLPRFHHQLVPNEIRLEKKGFSNDTLLFLQSTGFNLTDITFPESVVNGIVSKKDNKCRKFAVTAVTDIRKYGIAAAY